MIQYIRPSFRSRSWHNVEPDVKGHDHIKDIILVIVTIFIYVYYYMSWHLKDIHIWPNFSNCYYI